MCRVSIRACEKGGPHALSEGRVSQRGERAFFGAAGGITRPSGRSGSNGRFRRAAFRRLQAFQGNEGRDTWTTDQFKHHRSSIADRKSASARRGLHKKVLASSTVMERQLHEQNKYQRQLVDCPARA